MKKKITSLALAALMGTVGVIGVTASSAAAASSNPVCMPLFFKDAKHTTTSYGFWKFKLTKTVHHRMDGKKYFEVLYVDHNRDGKFGSSESASTQPC